MSFRSTPDYYDAANIVAINDDVKQEWATLRDEMENRTRALKVCYIFQFYRCNESQ